MTKKSIIIRLFAAIAALSLMLPAVLTRVDNEDNNRDVIVAMNYNNFEMTLSKNEFDKALTDYKAIGVKTAVVAEESVNSLISAGYITGIKYNVLCHKYDDESEEIIKILAKDPNIHNDSYVLVTKRQDCKDYLDLWLPAKYKSDEFVKLETDYNATVYVIYEGAADAWQISTGFVVDKIKKAKENGYDVALSMMVGNYSTAKYIDTTKLRKKVGMVFQQPNPFPISIYDNIAYGPRVHGITNRAELDEIVEKSLCEAAVFDEVRDMLKKNACRLSGGQQQRVCIARALAVCPEILLMDEPTSALDPISTGKIENLMRSLREKYTVIIVTHNMQQALRISDNTAFFLTGEIVEYDSTKQLFTSPKCRKTLDYVSGRFG